MTKRIIAFICVLTLVVSMCSVFSFAAEPDVKVPQEGTRTGGVHYKVRTATYMYVNPSTTSAYAYPSLIPVGTDLVANNVYLGFACVTYKSCTGYIPLSRLTEQQ